MAVIASALEDFPTAQKIDAAVADVRPERAAVLHQANRAGCTRPQFERQIGAELRDFLVRAAERQMQEAERIEDRLRRVPEAFDQRLDGGLRGLGAIGMTTHAVDDDEQGGMLRDRDGYAILIVVATT